MISIDNIPEKDKIEKASAAKKILGFILKVLIATVLVMCVFACFHHVIPRFKASKAEPPAPVAVTRVTPEPTPTPVPVEEEPEEPDLRTEWQKKFEDYFTDEIVVTENSYSSPNVSINIETVTTEAKGQPLVYHVADIHIGSIENFQTYLASGEFGYYRSETPLDIAEHSEAIVSINGDYCNNQYSGLLVRNGDVYMTAQTDCDICVLFYDGTMETYRPDEYVSEEILERNPYQVWKFGPKLLDGNGQPCTSFNTGTAILWENPRSGIGYYEPGHYCFIIVDGRQQGYSRGIEADGFAQIFADLGCVSAYNMDGGASAVMVFNGEEFSRKSNGGRDLGDIILIREVPEASEEEVIESGE